MTRCEAHGHDEDHPPRRRGFSHEERQAVILGFRLVRQSGRGIRLTPGQRAHIMRGLQESAWRRLPWWRRLLTRGSR